MTTAKLKKADPAERSLCKSDPDAAVTAGTIGSSLNGSAFPAIAYRCQNTSMAELAINVQQWAGPDIDHPVRNATGIEGSRDFVVYFWPRQIVQNPARTADGSAATAAEPNAAVTIYEALEKELGLKRDVQKRPYPVTVVDRLEPLPQ